MELSTVKTVKKSTKISNPDSSLAAVVGMVPTTTDSSRSVRSITDLSDAVIRGLSEILIHHGASNAIRNEMSSQIRTYLSQSADEGKWIKRIKYVLAYPLAQFLKNDLPPIQDEPFRPSGGLKRWMKNRLLTFNNKNIHLWYSWYQAKRSALPVSEDMVKKAYDEHFQTLSSPDEGHEWVIQRVFSDPTFQNVINKVAEGITSQLHDFSEFSPSTSACYEATRSQGGQYSVVRDFARTHWSDGTELHSMRFHPIACRNERIYFNVTQDVRQHSESYFKELFHWRDQIDDAPCDAKIQAILEPLKIRIISKGNALPYYFMKPLQKAMHTVMRKMPCFRLIGRSFCPTDIIDLADKSNPGDKWFSVDYSAATDGLSWKYSGEIFRRIISRLSETDQKIAMKVLGPHRLSYPEEEAPRGMQTNGQLMGSILSFPILCLANLGVYLANTRDHQTGWTDRQRLNHVLINGDDMVYCAPESLWSSHIHTSGACGLKMSVGKAYVHSKYLNINSTSVVYDLEKHHKGVERQHPRKIDFLNVGLFFNQRKVMDDEPVKSIPIMDKLLQGSLPGRQQNLLSRFLNLHSERVREEQKALLCLRTKVCSFRRNLFLPISVGGCGVTPPVGMRFHVTKKQRICASTYLTSDLIVNSQRPVLGYEMYTAKDVVNETLFKRMADTEEALTFKVHREEMSNNFSSINKVTLADIPANLVLTYSRRIPNLG